MHRPRYVRVFLVSAMLALMLAPSMATPTAAQLMPGGIAYLTDRDGNVEVYVMHADGSNPMRLTNTPTHEDSPA